MRAAVRPAAWSLGGASAGLGAPGTGADPYGARNSAPLR
jgi:hypothetical protein